MPPSSASRSRTQRAVDVATDAEAWERDDVASPLAALVAAAADAGVVDPRALAERLDLEQTELDAALADPSRLARHHRDALARLLGVDRAVVRAACEAATRRAAPLGTDDGDDASSAPTPRPEPEPAPERAPAPEPEPEVAVAELPELQPRSLAELLERTVAAVADDARGRRIRLALLTTVQTAAAEARRPLPPAVHEIRKRVLAGAVPWVGDGGVFVDAPNADDERALLDAVAQAVHAAQALHVGAYNGLFAPTHDDALDALLRRAMMAVRATSLGATSECVVTPPLFGRHLVICSADAPADQRRVAVRRALAHVLCGHVGEHAPLPSPAPAAVARAADVFALADLVPFWQIDEWRRAKLGWRTTMREAAHAAERLAPDWDAARAEDAARLRVLLYRERKI